MPVPVRDEFADASATGVPIPTPPAALPADEAASPARRSAFVRAAQRKRTRRPDLLPAANSLDA